METNQTEPFVGELYDLTVLNSNLRDRFKRLENRLLWCRECVYESRGSIGALNRYRSEISALEWSLRTVIQYYTEHPKEPDNQKPTFVTKEEI